MASRFLRYVQDTRREMAHVSWPTRAQTISFTIMVVVLSMFVAVYLSVFDAAFSNVLRSAIEYAPRFTNKAEPSVQLKTVDTTTETESGNLPEFTVTPIIDESSDTAR